MHGSSGLESSHNAADELGAGDVLDVLLADDREHD